MKKISILLCIMFFFGCSSVSVRESNIKKQKGVASWYGKKYHGRKTASGEVYNMWAMTAAHKQIKFGKRVKVTNLKNGKSVIVKINDRGPFVKGRIIDLSYAAFKKIANPNEGIIKVKIEVLN